MRKFFAVALGSVVALAGFAGAANASATVDLIWIDASVTATSGAVICLRAAKRNCPRLGATIGDVTTGATTNVVTTSDSITLAVILTAGPLGSIGGGVSVDHQEMTAAQVGVTGFQSMTTTVPMFYLPSNVGFTTDDGGLILNINSAGGLILNINSAAAPSFGVGIGLPSGASAYLGTVTFHKDVNTNGTFETAVGTFGGTDDILDGGSPCWSWEWVACCSRGAAVGANASLAVYR